MSELLRADNLVKDYYHGDVRIPVLQGANFSVNRGEILSIVGASGVGKSTLLHILGLLDKPTSGAVYREEHNLSLLPDRVQSRMRNQIFGFVFQFYHLLQDFNVIENLMMPPMIAHGFLGWGVARRSRRDRAKKLLEAVGLSHRIHHKPNQLSGGEMQRAAIVRALMNEPEILLCDEPTGNLDTKSGEEIVDLLLELHNQLNLTIIVVTHDQNLAKMGSRVMHMVDGKIT